MLMDEEYIVYNLQTGTAMVFGDDEGEHHPADIQAKQYLKAQLEGEVSNDCYLCVLKRTGTVWRPVVYHYEKAINVRVFFNGEK